MQKAKMTKFAAFAVLALSSWAPAAVAGSTWSLGSPNCTQNGTAAGNSFTNCAGVGAASNPTISQATAFSTTGTGAAFATAALANYGGTFGVTAAGESTGSPQHSLDNNGFTDAVVLSFSSSVILRQLTLGWAAYDSDFSVLRYTGTTAPVIAGKTIAQLLSGGWSAVGNYMNTVGSPVQADGGGSVNATANINASGFSSSWWLISAFNSAYGGANIGGAADGTSDYVKLLSVAGDKLVSSVPEPASLALVVAALLGAVYASRGRKDKLRQLDRSVRC